MTANNISHRDTNKTIEDSFRRNDGDLVRIKAELSNSISPEYIEQYCHKISKRLGRINGNNVLEYALNRLVMGYEHRRATLKKMLFEYANKSTMFTSACCGAAIDAEINAGQITYACTQCSMPTTINHLSEKQMTLLKLDIIENLRLEDEQLAKSFGKLGFTTEFVYGHKDENDVLPVGQSNVEFEQKTIRVNLDETDKKLISSWEKMSPRDRERSIKQLAALAAQQSKQAETPKNEQ